jgi:hypothetical protein
MLMRNQTRAAMKMFVLDSTIEGVVLNLKKISSIGIIRPPPPIPAAFAKAIIVPITSNPKNSKANRGKIPLCSHVLLSPQT